MKTLLLSTCLATCLIGSCFKDNTPDMDTDKVKSTGAVVVGMYYSETFGECPGCDVDARNMYNILKQYTDNVVKLMDQKATRSAVSSALKDAISKYDNVIFYYSGHGGSSKFSDTGAEEDDGQDEYLCLNDTYMRDNEIWSIISKSKGKVFLMFDACHSKTMFRTPGVTMRKNTMRLGAIRGARGFKMLCWSGCPDNTVSYGAGDGGKLTNTLVKHIKSTDTYESLWKKISTDKKLLEYEIPQQTVMDFNVQDPVFK